MWEGINRRRLDFLSALLRNEPSRGERATRTLLKGAAMNRKIMVTIGISAWISVLGALAFSAQDKYSAKVPGGLAM